MIIGSARPGRFGPVVASWAIEHARQRGHVDIDTIDVADHQGVDHETVASSLVVRLAEADAFLFVVPEYNHSFPGELKTVINRFKDERAKKAVGFVSYGGLAGGLRAVEQLRLVFIELSAAPATPSVFTAPSRPSTRTATPTSMETQVRPSTSSLHNSFGGSRHYEQRASRSQRAQGQR